MPAVRAQVVLRTVDAVPANFVTNSWAFNLADVGADQDIVSDLLWEFYVQIAGYYPSSIAQNGHEIKWYDLPGTPPNYPYETETRNFSAAPTGTRLPSEVAVCCSFQGTKTPGLPQARRRGRVYIGPLDQAQNNDGRPASAMLTVLADQMGDLAAGVVAGASTGSFWGVWSPTDGDIVNVTNGWVDNAFDTQRRRGEEYTSRTTWAI